MKLHLFNNNILNKGLLKILDSKFNLLKSFAVLSVIFISLLVIGCERFLFLICPLKYRKIY
jgi:hypothetical protein